MNKAALNKKNRHFIKDCICFILLCDDLNNCGITLLDYNANIILYILNSDSKLPTLMPAAGIVRLHKASPVTGIPVQLSSDCPTFMPVASTQ